MKRISIWMVFFMVAAMVQVSAGWTDNDFDNLEYTLSYAGMEGTFHIYLVTETFEIERTFVFPLVRDAAGDAILDWMSRICDQGSESYDPELCDFAERFFTDEIIDGINAQWNVFMDRVEEILPGTLQTHQMPFPMLTVGSIRLDDMTWEWPCAWNPVTGDFMPVPFYNVPIYQGTYGDISWTVDVTAVLSGTVYRDQGYAMDGSFEAGAGFSAESDRFSLCTSLGITGLFSGLP